MNIQLKDTAGAATNAQLVRSDPRFQKLVKARSSLGWTLTIIMCIIYFGLIALVAFDKPLVAQPVGNGPTSLGIALGIAVIISAWVLVGIYVAIANTRFDALTRELKNEVE